MTKQLTIAEAEELFKDDIKWAVETGIGFDGAEPACGLLGKWVKYDSACGVCAVGAHVIRHSDRLVTLNTWKDQVTVTARDIGWTIEDVDLLFNEVATPVEDREPEAWKDEELPIVDLAYRLRDYGDELMRNKK